MESAHKSEEAVETGAYLVREGGFFLSSKVNFEVFFPVSGSITVCLTFFFGIKEAPVHLVAGKLQKEIRETEQDNVGVESAHKSEEAVETGAYLVRYSRQSDRYAWRRHTAF